MANVVTNQEQEAVPAPGAARATAMVLGSDAFRAALEPAGRTDAWDLAELMASEGRFGLSKPGEALAKLMYGRTLGIPAVHAFQSLHSIEGKIGADASLLHAICLRSPLCEYFEPVLAECDMTKATFVTKRAGRPEQKLVYTIEEAEAMGVIDRGKDEDAKKKNNWNRHRKAMLMARCKSALARAVYPDLTHGLYSTDELEALREGDPNEIAGEVLSSDEAAAEAAAGRVTTIQGAPRDYAKEAEAIKAKLVEAGGNTEARAAIRKEIEMWDGVEPYKQQLGDFYNKTRPKRGGATTGAAAPATAEAQPPAPNAGPLGEGNLFGESTDGPK